MEFLDRKRRTARAEARVKSQHSELQRKFIEKASLLSFAKDKGIIPVLFLKNDLKMGPKPTK